MFLCSFNTYSKLFMRIYYVTLLIMSIFKFSKTSYILEANKNVFLISAHVYHSTYMSVMLCICVYKTYTLLTASTFKNSKNKLQSTELIKIYSVFLMSAYINRSTCLLYCAFA